MHTKKRYTFESRCDVVKKNHSSPPALNAGQTKTGLPPKPKGHEYKKYGRHHLSLVPIPLEVPYCP